MVWCINQLWLIYVNVITTRDWCKDSSESVLFVGVFAKLQNLTVSFIMSDCMHGKNCASTGWIFMKFDMSGYSYNLLKNSGLIKI
jgi:hypothetical protein